HAKFSLGINARRSIIKDQDLRLMRQCASERDELLLSGGERRSALPHLLVKALRQLANKLGEIYVLRRLLDVRILDALGAQPDIAADCSCEQKGILQDHPKPAAQPGEIHLF